MSYTSEQINTTYIKIIGKDIFKYLEKHKNKILQTIYMKFTKEDAEIIADEYLELDSKDKLYSSSYVHGIVEFDEEKDEYIHRYYHSTYKLGDIEYIKYISN